MENHTRRGKPFASGSPSESLRSKDSILKSRETVGPRKIGLGTKIGGVVAATITGGGIGLGIADWEQENSPEQFRSDQLPIAWDTRALAPIENDYFPLTINEPSVLLV